MRTILITGATGKQGGAVAHELLKRGHAVRAMTRRPDGDAAKELQKLGATIVAGDLDDAALLGHALTGVWGVWAVQNTWEAGVGKEEEQGKRLAKLAREKGVQHYVYSSVGSAHRKTGIPHFDNKWRIEETVRGLKFPYRRDLREGVPRHAPGAVSLLRGWRHRHRRAGTPGHAQRPAVLAGGHSPADRQADGRVVLRRVPARERQNPSIQLLPVRHPHPRPAPRSL